MSITFLPISAEVSQEIQKRADPIADRFCLNRDAVVRRLSLYIQEHILSDSQSWPKVLEDGVTEIVRRQEASVQWQNQPYPL